MGATRRPAARLRRFETDRPMNLLRTLSLLAAAFLVTLGVLVVAGYVGAVVPEPRLRITLGVIMILMGLYRAALGLSPRRGRDD